MLPIGAEGWRLPAHPSPKNSRAPQAVSVEFVLRDPHAVEAERQGWVSNAAPEPEDLRTFRTVVQLATP